VKRFLLYSCRSLFSLCLISLGPGVDAGVLEGHVSVPQQKSSEAPRRYFKGPYRSGHGHRVVQDGPQNVVVYFPGVTASEETRPDAVMRQVNERFVPHVLPKI